MKDTVKAIQSIEKYKKMKSIYDQFKSGFYIFLESENNEFPISDLSVEYSYFTIFQAKVALNFKFTFDSENNRYVGAIYFQVQTERWVPVLTMFFDELSNLYFEENLDSTSWKLKQENICELIIAQLAASVMERNELSRFVSVMNSRMEEP